MTRNIKRMITMKTHEPSASRRRLRWRCALAGCATRAGPSRPRSRCPTRPGGAAVTERETISKAGADQLIPKEKKRDDHRRPARRLREGDEALPGGPRATAPSRAPSARASPTRSSASPTTTPACSRRASTRAPVLYECGRDDEAARIWERPASTARRSPTSATSPGRTTSTGRAESLFKQRDRRRSAAQRRGAQQPRADPARQGAQGVEQRREEELRRPGGQQPAHGAGARQQQPAGVLHAGVHLLRHEHAGDGQAGRQPGHQEGRGDRDREVRRGEGRGGRRRQGGRRQGQGQGRRAKEKADDEGDEEAAKPKEIGREAGTGVTGDMKKQLAVVHNTLGLVELKKKNISPAIKQFKEAVSLNPNFAEARLNLAALSLNNRDYMTAEENFRAVDQAAAEELRGRDRPRRRAARQQEDRRGRGAVQRRAEARPVAGRQLLQPRPALPGVQGRPEALAAEGAGLLPPVPRPRVRRHAPSRS